MWQKGVVSRVTQITLPFCSSWSRHRSQEHMETEYSLNKTAQCDHFPSLTVFARTCNYRSFKRNKSELHERYLNMFNSK